MTRARGLLSTRCAPTVGRAVVRFNGGAQAAHNVVVGEQHHTFSQFGSGTLSGTPTLLSRYVLVEPIALAAEARGLAALGVADPLSLLSIDGNALLTTPIHVAANRAREDARGADRHGSCGKGIGETAWYALVCAQRPAVGSVFEGQRVPGTAGSPPTVGDCGDPATMRRKLDALARFYGPLADFPSVAGMVDLYREFADAVRIVPGDEIGRLVAQGKLVFEGAQGVLLDQWRGFHPHTTWSTVTPDERTGPAGRAPGAGARRDPHVPDPARRGPAAHRGRDDAGAPPRAAQRHRPVPGGVAGRAPGCRAAAVRRGRVRRNRRSRRHPPGPPGRPGRDGVPDASRHRRSPTCRSATT